MGQNSDSLLSDLQSTNSESQPSEFPEHVGIVLILVGIILMVVGCFGCCGAIRESKFRLVLVGYSPCLNLNPRGMCSNKDIEKSLCSTVEMWQKMLVVGVVTAVIVLVLVILLLLPIYHYQYTTATTNTNNTTITTTAYRPSV